MLLVGIGAMLPLNAGDLVYVCDPSGETFNGVVEITAPHLKVLWVRTSVGDRKLVDVSQCTIQRMG